MARRNTLTVEDVLYVRYLRDHGWLRFSGAVALVAQELGVSRGYVNNLASRNNRDNIPEDPSSHWYDNES